MTSKTNYDPGYISSFFDDYADCEWERLGRDAASRVNFLVHRHHLRQWVKSAMMYSTPGPAPDGSPSSLRESGQRSRWSTHHRCNSS